MLYDYNERRQETDYNFDMKQGVVPEGRRGEMRWYCNKMGLVLTMCEHFCHLLQPLQILEDLFSLYNNTFLLSLTYQTL